LTDLIPLVPVQARYRWLWLFALPYALRKQILTVPCRLTRWLGPAWAWAGVGAILGAVPVGIDLLLGTYSSWLVSPVLVFPLLLGAAARDRTLRGIALLAGMGVAHSVATITLAALAPAYWAELLPEGAAYWERSRHWILTGESEEYQLSWWLPGHLQLLAAVVGFAYLSLGLTPLWQGLYELDLMNYYVSQLLVSSADPATALLLGWHPWSVCRGIGFLFLTFELTSFSLERMTATPLSTRRKRLGRWVVGLSFLAGDMLIKYLALEPVRQLLAGGLTF
jgi:hypothetical protein